MSSKELPQIIEKSSKEILLDKIFWFKISLSLITGIAYGVFGLTGFISFLLFFLGITILSSVYYRQLTSDEDDSDYQTEVFVEGLNVAIPLFLLSWIIVNTLNIINSN